MESLDFLIKYLLEEREEKLEYKRKWKEEKKKLFRCLCNIREPMPIDSTFLEVQDNYLQNELKRKGIKMVDEKDEVEDGVYIWRGDITLLRVEAIVNAANSQGLGCFIPLHKCIDNAIHSASGVQLRIECAEKMEEIGFLETGKAFITNAYNLPSEFVIHTVGPIIEEEVTACKKQELEQAYMNSLEVALRKGIKEIAFPCISTGEFHFPKKEACQIAIKAIQNFRKENKEVFHKIIFDVFSEEEETLYRKEWKELNGKL